MEAKLAAQQANAVFDNVQDTKQGTLIAAQVNVAGMGQLRQQAGDVIKAIAPAINGGGGGRPNLAQAGGKKPAGIPTALKQAAEYLNK